MIGGRGKRAVLLQELLALESGRDDRRGVRGWARRRAGVGRGEIGWSSVEGSKSQVLLGTNWEPPPARQQPEKKLACCNIVATVAFSCCFVSVLNLLCL